MYSEIALRQLTLNTNALYIVLAWAGLCIAGGLVLATRHKPSSAWRWFYLMHFASGVVLAAAAGIMLWIVRSIQPGAMTLREVLYIMFNIEKILAFSMGICIAVAAIGVVLIASGIHKKKARFVGFGRAFWVQGLVLLVLTVVLFVMNMAANKEYAYYILF